MPVEPNTSTAAMLPHQGIAVADAGWFTTENLFRELRRDNVSTLLLTCKDYRNAWQSGQRPWSWRSPLRQISPQLWRRDLVLPTGWMKQFPRLGMRPIARSVRNWRRELMSQNQLSLIMTYPHYLHLRDQLQPARTLYYNLDDYTLYWPNQAAKIRALEQKAVRESDLTLCVSHLRAEELRASIPEAAERIRYLPHGTPSTMLAEHPHHLPAAPPHDIAHLPRPLLGYVGSIEDRVDWQLLHSLSEAIPQASIVLVGRPTPPPYPPEGWLADYARCLLKPNIHAIGWRPQESLLSYNNAFDVCLIPYRVDHPFNRVCCPTKIMDSMGSGRPIVATSIPECLLYRRLFDVPEDPNAFIASVQAVLAINSDDGRAEARHEHARRNTCGHVADQLLDWLF